MATEYFVGSVTELTLEITQDGAAVDPSTLKLHVKRPPTGIVTTYIFGEDDIVQDDTGHFHFRLALTASGTWKYRWEGTGDATGAFEGAIQVQPQTVIPNP